MQPRLLGEDDQAGRVVPAFWSSRSTCLSTVRVEMKSRSRTSRLVAPEATSASTSTARLATPRAASVGGTALVSPRALRGTGAPSSLRSTRQRAARASWPDASKVARLSRSQAIGLPSPLGMRGRGDDLTQVGVVVGVRGRGEPLVDHGEHRFRLLGSRPARPAAATASATRYTLLAHRGVEGEGRDLRPGCVAIVVEDRAEQRPLPGEHVEVPGCTRGRPCGVEAPDRAAESPATTWYWPRMFPSARASTWPRSSPVARAASMPASAAGRSPSWACMNPSRMIAIGRVDNPQRRDASSQRRAVSKVSATSPRASWSADSWRSTIAAIASAPASTAIRRAESNRSVQRHEHVDRAELLHGAGTVEP